MSTKGMSKSGLFLIELIIAIIFFSFCCTITLQLFVKSSLLEKNAADLSNGMMVAQSAAEGHKGSHFEELTLGEETTYFDQNWQRAEEPNSTYMLKSEIAFVPCEAGVMADLTYTVYRGEAQVFSLAAQKYYGGMILANSQEEGEGHEN